MSIAQLSVKQAADRVGLSRQTMFRHIKDGKISATTNHAGQKQINIAELLRVFGELQPETAIPETVIDRSRQKPRDKETAPVTTTAVAYQIELVRLQAQLDIKKAELELAKERINELKAREHGAGEEKNRLLTLIEQQSRLLAAPTPKAAPRKKAAPIVARAAPKAAAPKTRMDTIGKKAQTVVKATAPKLVVAQPDRKPPAVKSAASKTTSKTPAKKRTVK